MKTYGAIVLAFMAGYICGHVVSERQYRDQQEENEVQCWAPERPGDYPQVFVIDKRGVYR